MDYVKKVVVSEGNIVHYFTNPYDTEKEHKLVEMPEEYAHLESRILINKENYTLTGTNIRMIDIPLVQNLIRIARKQK